MNSLNVFENVGVEVPPSSSFDLSYSKKFTADMGLLYIGMADEMVPNDVFNMGLDVILRANPMVYPLMSEINVYSHYYFIPFRLLWDNSSTDSWEVFITGREQQNPPEMPVWNPTNTDVGSLWDVAGFPIGYKTNNTDTSYLPSDWIRRAYNMIYNHYYRDQFLEENELPLTNEVVQRRAWAKDYFTTASITQQHGIAPALPLTGLANVDFTLPDNLTIGSLAFDKREGSFSDPAKAYATRAQNVLPENFYALEPGGDRSRVIEGLQLGLLQEPATSGLGLNEALNYNNSIDLSNLATFTMNDFRTLAHITRMLELDLRSGLRYPELLAANFGVQGYDPRFQRPEYIGGTKTQILVSEVLQTANMPGSPLGDLGGHGISVGSGQIETFRAVEFGLVMSIVSIMPVADYVGGINRQWLRKTRYDHYFPNLADLGMQEILNAEIKATGQAEDNGIFGFQGRFDEMRTKQNMICGQMATDYSFTHLGRIFQNKPNLNNEFIKCNPRKDFLAVPSEPAFVLTLGNRIHAIRPLPVMNIPSIV